MKKKYINGNAKKNSQLGIKHGTANNKLRKLLLFHLAKKSGMDMCFRCISKIETVKEFSIDHKVNWLDSENPIEVFLDVENVVFSHLRCNIKSARRNKIRDDAYWLEYDKKWKEKNYPNGRKHRGEKKGE